MTSMVLLAGFALAPMPAAARRAARPPRAPEIDVRSIGARAAAATDAMKARVQERVARQLRVLTDLRLLTSPGGYLVDGSIDTFETVALGDVLEISCSVRLIVSARGSGAMLAMTTGQAALKDARRPVKPAAQARLELDVLQVLDAATRAAADELISHFEARRKS
jgi:hypothetical protein